MMIVDSHCHLDFKVLSDDLEGVIERARRNGVDVMQTICTKISEFERIYSISHANKNIFCSIGNHPLNLIEEGLVKAQEILLYTNRHKLIGIGETGLDYYYSKDNKKVQKESFIEHIIASQESLLPIIVHTRKADKDTVDILKEYMVKKKFSGVIHCFTASNWLAKECLDMGLYISFSGIITFKNSKDIQQILKEIPMGRILIETDSPYLAPVPMRGRDNEPSYLKYTAEFMAKLLDVSTYNFIGITTNNFFNLFNKAKV